MRTHFFVLAVLSAVSLSGCNQGSSTGSSASAIDQSNLCEVSAWRHDEVASECKLGQKVVFLPSSFGNEQLPIIFAAVNCDLRYSVALTTGAVTCIYGPITPKPAEPQKQPTETPSK
ncbi:MAG: hypothetical protein ACOY4L_00675 [Pseudomonadota bacterium]